MRKLVKELRLDLTNVEFWYCKISEEQWSLILNALSGVRTNLLSAERKAADAFLANLKQEFGNVGTAHETGEKGLAREDAEAHPHPDQTLISVHSVEDGASAAPS